ncbi:MAG TPA: carbohydrate binding domain-containing protein [Opitutaceae bacterium]
MGVTGYVVLRDGTPVATTTTTGHTDGGLLAATTYSYTVRARDAAGNTSAASNALNVTTSANNTVTVYYRKGFSTPHIHYRAAGGTWTTAPGLPMPAAELAGYAKSTINLGPATQLECVFNNGSGTWDNNGGQNYFIPAGIHTFDAGTITAGAPTPDTTPPPAPSGLVASSIASTSVSLAWNAVTDPSGIAGYRVHRDGAQVGSPASITFTDSGLAGGTTYSYTVDARDNAGNVSAASALLSVTTNAPGAAVTFHADATTV